MGSKYLKAFVAAASVFLAGCAHESSTFQSPFSQGPAILAATAKAPPPPGVFGLCVRAPEVCGLDRAIEPVSAQSAWATGGSPGAASKDSTDGADIFHAWLRAEIAAPDGGVAQRVEVPASPALLRQLAELNRKINWRILASEDIETYGETEHWALPLTRPDAPVGKRAKVRGDCEDYALEKRAALLAQGIPPDALGLSVVFKPSVGLHTILVVRTDNGDLILDNLARDLMRVDDAGYTFVSMQVGDDLMHWTSARLARARSDLDPVPPLESAAIEEAALAALAAPVSVAPPRRLLIAALAHSTRERIGRARPARIMAAALS